MKFYRYIINQYALGYNDDYPSSGYVGTKLELQEYSLVKETPKGYWISYGDSDFHGFQKWVSKTSRKRFAYPTEKEALNNFIIRTTRRAEILRTQLDACTIALNLAKKKENE